MNLSKMISTEEVKNIYVIGAGSFGTAVANQLAFSLANKVHLICRSDEQANEINTNHTNLKYFPNKALHKSLRASSSFKELSNATIVFMALPTVALQNNIANLKQNIPGNALIVNLSKGIFEDGVTLVDYLKTTLEHNNVVTMKGPTFAVELINNEHSLFTLGYETDEQYRIISELVENTNIHIDKTTDIRGVELLSSLKNIYAIIIGIVDAQYNAINTRHMILTKAFTEIRILLKALGGLEDTLFLGCGYGDFGLTALNDLSRNRTLGLLIGKGFYNIDVNKSNVVLEGLKTMDLISSASSTKEVKATLPLFNKLESFFKNKEANFAIHFDSLIEGDS